MNEIKYLDFDLLIEREGERYQVRVYSPGGEVTSTFDKPFSEEELEEFLQLVGYSWEAVHDVEEEAKKFGGRLFDKVFGRRVYARLSESINDANDENKGLRIRLRLNDVPELAELPWEYLYDTEVERFLFLSSNTPLVRYLERPERIRPFRVKRPLRFLVMISNPADGVYSPLNVEKEWKQLNESLESLHSEGQVELVQVEATASALQEQLRRGTFHIFHFIGHGGFDPEFKDGFLVMSDKETPTLSGEQLGRLLYDHKTLRLVVLNACEGARGSRSNPFSGVAQSLVKYGIPAVISMQFEITDDAAIIFSKQFYKALADYYPVDAALAEARKEISRSRKRVEWGTPALYMRPSDGAIFAEGDWSPPPIKLGYRGIMKAITQGRLVPFLGARANLGDRTGNAPETLFPPSDDQLAARLAGICGSPGEVKGLVGVSQFFALKNSQELSSELYDALTEYLSVPSLHELLADLPGILKEKGYPFPYQLIVTTNYDDALEKAFVKKKEEFDLIYYEAEGGHGGRFCYKPWGGSAEPIKKANSFQLPDFEKRTLILKIHGEVDRSNSEGRRYAITEDDYIYYLSGKSINQYLPAQVIKRLKESQHLFLGYRLHDWNLRVFYQRIFGDAKPPDSWVIQSESENDPFDEEFWKSRDMKIVKDSQEDFVKEIKRRLQELKRVEVADE
ncbi:MAG: CHAT domain-containing protein [Acidobacteriota bacterium]